MQIHASLGGLPLSFVGSAVGNIQIESRLGSGGMGEVYLGFDRRLERRVAVKTIRPEQHLSAEGKARFLREARLLSKLGHPGICQVFDLIETPAADFLVLEYIEGKTLRQLAAGAEAAVALGRAEDARDDRAAARAAYEKAVTLLAPCRRPLRHWKQLAPWVKAQFGLGRRDETLSELRRMLGTGYRGADVAALVRDDSALLPAEPSSDR